MKKDPRIQIVLPAAMAALLLGTVAPASWAGGEDKNPFSVATVFFELNDTDGDLGIHALIDGEPWKTLMIDTPDGRENLRISLRGRLRQQGLTELFFESAEPSFDELAPEEFFRRFPEGEYEVEGRTIEGDELESTVMVTHLLPAPAEDLTVNDKPVSEDCEVDPGPEVFEPFTFAWGEVELSHPDLGRPNEPIDVVKYELIVERIGPALKFSVDLPPDVRELELPEGLTEPGDTMKVEVLVREAGGNQTAVESCFRVK